MRFLTLALALFLSTASFAATSYRDAVTVRGTDVMITQAAFEHIGNEGLLEIVMQAGADPVFDAENTQVGYLLRDIDADSIFATVGLKDYDIVLEVAGMELSDPKRSVDILRFARELRDFEVLVRRDGMLLKFRVRVSS